MARMSADDNYEPTILSDREIAGTGLGVTPAGVSFVSDLQRAVYQLQPADTADAQAAAAQADTKAEGAQASADQAGTAAGAAQTRADDAYTLAGTKVAKDVGPSWQTPTATPSRAAFGDYSGTAAAVYTQADMQALMDRVALLTSIVAGLVTDGRANHSLTN